MSAPMPPQDEHLTLLPGGKDFRSAGRRQLRGKIRERGELQPGGKQVKVGIAGRRGTGRGALRGDLERDALRVSPTAQPNREQSSRVRQTLSHELLESKPQLRLVVARREVSLSTSLLTQRSEISHEALEGRGVGMQQQLAPDNPEWGGRLGQLVTRTLRAVTRGLIEALSNRRLRQPAPGVGHTGGTGHGSQRAEADRMPEQALSVGAHVQAERPMQQVGSLCADPKRRPLKVGSPVGSPRPEGVSTKQRREFVGGRERVRGLSKRRISEGDSRLLGGSEGRETLRGRHGVNRPMPIDEVRAARGRGGEDRV